jgi:hypothetical protein
VYPGQSLGTQPERIGALQEALGKGITEISKGIKKNGEVPQACERTSFCLNFEVLCSNISATVHQNDFILETEI